MSSSFLKTLFKTVKKESNSFAEKFAVASRSGAEVAAKQILEAATNLNQPSDVLIGKVVDALKAGVQQTGHQMLTAGLDLVKGVSSQPDTSKSAGSTYTGSASAGTTYTGSASAGSTYTGSAYTESTAASASTNDPTMTAEMDPVKEGGSVDDTPKPSNV